MNSVCVAVSVIRTLWSCKSYFTSRISVTFLPKTSLMLQDRKRSPGPLPRVKAAQLYGKVCGLLSVYPAAVDTRLSLCISFPPSLDL